MPRRPAICFPSAAMRTRPFGGTGVAVPVLGQGTWRMEQDDPRRALAALRRGLDLGMTHVDTAEMYGEGSVEAMLAPLVAERRSEIFLASKVLPENASRRRTRRAAAPGGARLPPPPLLRLRHPQGAPPRAPPRERRRRRPRARRRRARPPRPSLPPRPAAPRGADALSGRKEGRWERSAN